VFEVVTREVGLLSGADFARMERYETDGAVTGVAVWSRDVEAGLAVITRFALEGVSIAAMVRERSTVRCGSGPSPRALGPIAEEARELGIRSSVGCPIMVEGRLWGVIAASTTGAAPFPEETEARIGEFTELVATAVANAESRDELAASRARIVAAADETRRRIERDLHDGAQQRVVTLALELRSAASAIPPELRDMRAELDAVVSGLDGVLEDLRGISRGIHPAILSEGGLGPALRTLARRSSVPVVVNVGVERRLPEGIEVAAYYVVSEALTNTAKHAEASEVEVDVDTRDGLLRLSIRDDGIGGPDPGRGPGSLASRTAWRRSAGRSWSRARREQGPPCVSSSRSARPGGRPPQLLPASRSDRTLRQQRHLHARRDGERDQHPAGADEADYGEEARPSERAGHGSEATPMKAVSRARQPALYASAAQIAAVVAA
jgi:signal transduction histidine kinase